MDIRGGYRNANGLPPSKEKRNKEWGRLINRSDKLAANCALYIRLVNTMAGAQFPQHWLYTYVHIDMYIPIYIHMLIYVYIHTYIYVYMYTYICIYSCTYAYIYTHIYICMYMYIFIYIYIHIYMYTSIHIHMHVFIYRYMYTYIDTFINGYLYIYIHMHMFVCLYLSLLSHLLRSGWANLARNCWWFLRSLWQEVPYSPRSLEISLKFEMKKFVWHYIFLGSISLTPPIGNWLSPIDVWTGLWYKISVNLYNLQNLEHIIP